MDRMKEQYEIRTRSYLQRRTYVLLRLDGVSFSKYTKGLERPFDKGLIDDMNEVAIFLCEKIQGARFSFVQSDEISILLTDFENKETSAWFDYEVQKIVSVSASMAAAKFNQLRLIRALNMKTYQIKHTEDENLVFDIVKNLKLPYFDSRAFVVSDPFEVANYFIARQKDCSRNSITMAAQSLYSHKELMGKSSSEKQEMMFKKGVNWNDYPIRFRRGGFICKKEIDGPNNSKRNKWICVDLPIFTQEQGFLYSQIPVISGASKVISLTELYNKTVEDGTSQICKLCNSKTGPDHVGGCDRDNEKGCAWNNNKQ